MDETLVENWNSVVRSEDTVINLGDVYFGRNTKPLQNLNGTKHLILGNHDDAKDVILQKHFSSIRLSSTLKSMNLILSHIPQHESQLTLPTKQGKVEKFVNIHGHIHNQPDLEGSYVNVSVEKTNYTPIELDEVYELAKGKL